MLAVVDKNDTSRWLLQFVSCLSLHRVRIRIAYLGKCEYNLLIVQQWLV
jgi:hypothetical protein